MPPTPPPSWRPTSGDDVPPAVLADVCAAAYATFRHPAVCPLVQIGDDEWLLELFHGPTLAFKDMALQVVGRLFDHVLGARGERVTIVGATSGDTGSAAIDAVAGRHNVDIVMLYPLGRVSEVQRLQMTTSDAPNVHAVAVEGTFDDCQDLVKAMFNDSAFRQRHQLSAVNSINWARVMAQIVYYATTVALLGDRRVSFAVPTGNFGNVLSGWIARETGAPIDRLIVGSNRNDILTRFFDTRTMAIDRRRADTEPQHGHPGVVELRAAAVRDERPRRRPDGRAAPPAPGGRTAGRRGGPAGPLAHPGLPGRPARRRGDRGRDALGATRRRACWSIPTPRSASARPGSAASRARPMVALATAHPAKFADAVERATGVRPALPDHLADLHDRPERTERVAATWRPSRRWSSGSRRRGPDRIVASGGHRSLQCASLGSPSGQPHRRSPSESPVVRRPRR